MWPVLTLLGLKELVAGIWTTVAAPPTRLPSTVKKAPMVPPADDHDDPFQPCRARSALTRTTSWLAREMVWYIKLPIAGRGVDGDPPPNIPIRPLYSKPMNSY